MRWTHIGGNRVCGTVRTDPDRSPPSFVLAQFSLPATVGIRNVLTERMAHYSPSPPPRGGGLFLPASPSIISGEPPIPDRAATTAERLLGCGDW